MFHFIGFLASAVVIFYAGRKLSSLADVISEIKGLGKAWVGLILLATVTSLPELMTGLSSSAIVQSADLAVGDILGSCSFNLCILAMMDVFVPMRRPLFGLASRSHEVSAALGIILISLAGAALFLPAEVVITSWIGLTSVLFIVIYFVSVRLIFINESKQRMADQTKNDQVQQNLSLKKAGGYFAMYASIIVIAALTLPYFAKHISEMLQLNISFVGTLFLAASTSLPEMAVSIGAVRKGSIDLAVGGLLGSNIFNILILALDDIFYVKGHILKDASDVNIISIFAVVIMSAIVIIGLSFHSTSKRYLLALDAFLIFVVYMANILLLYYLTL